MQCKWSKTYLVKKRKEKRTWDQGNSGAPRRIEVKGSPWESCTRPRGQLGEEERGRKDSKRNTSKKTKAEGALNMLSERRLSGE